MIATDIDYVQQQRVNALAAKNLHQWRLDTYGWRSVFTDWLTIVVTVLYFPARYLAKGSSHAELVEHAWEVSAAILLAATLTKMALKWQESGTENGRLMAENIRLAGEAEDLLRIPDAVTEDRLASFKRDAQRLETEDRRALGEIMPATKQRAYRESLKELKQNCHTCHASPWSEPAAKCRVCGI